ncbi:hypothetical protein [Marinobacterium sp. LSUCC0821]|uniref:hypothetical protein n=1 Tax=Marinobacterium sp. LSUCC0821 TaxID=2668067 RepID=UPI0014523413|nr:hypothetical protein [Marinobacterium sp. LSUCC0821]QJD72163.1 hypothetical protein HH196_10870 [Marinobacterium sp. LSUCC0821]
MIAVVSHDAGGAEILSSYIRRAGLDFNLVLSGPAVRVFERKLGSFVNVDLKTALHNSDLLLCGSSYPASFELEAIKQAREQGKRSVVFLDHWINYRQRFERNGFTVLPDEIWVGDPDAECIAREQLPEIPVRLIENPYFSDLIAEIQARARKYVNTDIKARALFLSQPISAHESRASYPDLDRGYTEQQALRYFLRNIHLLGQPVKEVLIRLHPSEQPGKYDGIEMEFDFPIRIDASADLIDSIFAVDFVVGMDSMAMVVGLLADKTVICCIPPEGKPCRLPHAEILHLRDW